MATPTLVSRSGSIQRPASTRRLPLPAEPLTALRALEAAGAKVKVSAAIPLGPCESRDCSASADVVLVTTRPTAAHQGFIYATRVCLDCGWLYAHADLRRGATATLLVPNPTMRVRAA